MVAMQELQHMMTGRQRGPWSVKPAEEERKQQEEGLMNRPDLDELVSRTLAQQAGGNMPTAWPWNIVKVCLNP